MSLTTLSKSLFFRTFVFFTIGVTISNMFRFETFCFGKILSQYPLLIQILSVPLQSISVFLGGVLGLFWLRHHRKTYHSLFGSSRIWSFIMALIPILLLSIVGIENTHNINSHLLGLLIGTILMVYCTFEEYGWRGYLEEELSGQKEWLRVLIIAALWYLWHLPFIDNLDLMSNLKFFGFMLLGSWGIGKVIQMTHSVIAAASFHMLYSILILQIRDEVYLAQNFKFIIIGICIVTFIIILNVWKNEGHKTNKEV